MIRLVLDQRHSAAAETRNALIGRIKGLEQRKDRFVEAFVYQRAVDEETYRAHVARLGDELAQAKGALAEEELAAPDLAGLLAFADYVAANAGALWRDASYDLKQRLQFVLLPKGIRYTQEGFEPPQPAYFSTVCTTRRAQR